MTPKEKAKEILKTFDNIPRYAKKAVDEIIEYHESLYNKGFKDVHIALSSPIKTYNDILNPLLNYWQEVKQEIEML